MKLYYEALETVPEDQEAEFIRTDVTDKTVTERAVILQDIKDLMVGKTYTLKEHFCRHDEGLACTTKDI